ncbi:uncharacterized protein LOC103712830 [Phoenix dactylifera]|uniref:Uncharacterized protein LOC103712830 n=1 Tax=Phoenix dactylifera TaxID=42345 RepID=A0A8B7CEZ2_PHODC|nr:uncharacterized protein LOC103712830 [Phoenix dactylifera]
MLQRKFTEVVVVPEEELERNRAEWRSTTVLVRSLGRSVPVDWVAREIKRVGRLGYEVECFTLMDGFIAVRFANEGDREAAMANDPWMVAGQLLAMDWWRPNFIPGEEGVGRVVVWLRLPRLPLDYWKKPTILRIASSPGIPLAKDGVTKQGRRYGFARVKIELDYSVPLKPGTLVRGCSEGAGELF